MGSSLDSSDDKGPVAQLGERLHGMGFLGQDNSYNI